MRRSTRSSTKPVRSRPLMRAGISTTMRLPDQCAVPVFLRRVEARISTSGRSKRGGSMVIVVSESLSECFAIRR